MREPVVVSADIVGSCFFPIPTIVLHRGVGITVIALCLGHESIQTTQAYLHADMGLKEKALARATKTKVPSKRYQPPDKLLAFLEGL